MDPNHYRFYSEKLPSAGQLVIVQVTSVTSLGVFVRLLEYACAEGMIVTSELTRRRFRSLRQVIWEGQILCCHVLRVDCEKEYIDLSKRRVTPDESKDCFDNYAKAKAVQSIVLRSCEKLSLIEDAEQVEGFFSQTAWQLNGRRGAYWVFKSAVSDPAALTQCHDLDPEKRAVLLDTIRSHLVESNVRVHVVATISVMCTGPDGVDAVKDALRAGLVSSDGEGLAVQIAYRHSPYYTASVQCPRRKTSSAKAAIKTAVESVKSRILQYRGGRFDVITEPVISGKSAHYSKR